MAVDIAEFDGAAFNDNWNKYLTEEANKYAGQCIAVSMDGTRILASGATPEEVEAKLAAAGIDASRVVHSYVFPPDVSIF